MKVVIAGSRSGMSYTDVKEAIRLSGFAITEVVSGGAGGVDTLGEQWAVENKIPITRFIPDWAKQGRAAGPIRNRDMAVYAEAVIVVWNGQSKGSKSMIFEAGNCKRPCYVYVKEQTNEKQT